MSDPSFEARMASHNLRLPAAEAAKLAELVIDLDRAAAAIRAVARGYAEEPSNVFRLTAAGGDRP